MSRSLGSICMAGTLSPQTLNVSCKHRVTPYHMQGSRMPLPAPSYGLSGGTNKYHIVNPEWELQHQEG